MSRSTLFVVALVLIGAATANAACISVDAGTPVSINFDALGALMPLTDGQSTTWTQQTTYSGVSVEYVSASAPTTITKSVVTTSEGSVGSQLAAGLYAYNVDNAAGDYALGVQVDGTTGTGYIGVCITNSHATDTMTSVIASYVLEQYRATQNMDQTIVFTYQKGATDLKSGSWTNPGAQWTGDSRIDTATGNGQLYNGNLSTRKRLVNSAGDPFTISVAPGETIYFRYQDIDDSGNEHALGVDELSFEFTFTPPSAGGDPWFMGFDGQQYQVHGAPGVVYNLISMACFQLNALFSFIGKEDGRTPAMLPHAQAVAANGRQYALKVSSTKQWTHPGNYLGQLGVKIGKKYDIVVTSGKWETGFSSVRINGEELAVGKPRHLDNSTDADAKLGSLLHKDDVINHSAVLADEIEADKEFGKHKREHLQLRRMKQNTIHRFSSHHLMLQLGEIDLMITNADEFINIDHISLHHMEEHTIESIEGLLGQTAKPHQMKSDGRKIADKDLSIHALNQKAMGGDVNAATANNKRGAHRHAHKYDFYAQDSQYHVDDYKVADNDIVGTQFLENRFGINKAHKCAL